MNKIVATLEPDNIILLKSNWIQPAFQFWIFPLIFFLSSNPFSSSHPWLSSCLLNKGFKSPRWRRGSPGELRDRVQISILWIPGSRRFWNMVCSIEILWIFIFAALIAWIVPVILIGPSFFGTIILAPVSAWIFLWVWPPFPIIAPKCSLIRALRTVMTQHWSRIKIWIGQS